MSAFESLRRTTSPARPDERFAARLRARIVAELAPTVDLPDRADPTTTATTSEEISMSDTMPATDDASRSAEVRITPYLAVHDAAAAIDWYRRVFAAREIVRYTGDDGRIGHAEVDLGGASIYLSDEYPDHGVSAARTLGGSAVGLNVLVPDVDVVWERALDAGADGLRPPEDQPYGERSSTFVDPFGHRWMVQTTIATPTTDEIEAGFGGAFTVTAPDRGEAATAAPTGGDRGGPDAPVEIGYVTMPVADTARAGRFFAALFGWEIEAGSLGDGYAHIGNTRLPMGLTPDGNDAAPALYFRVDDAERYAARVVELGGDVIERTGYASGANVVCRDAQGGRFVLWQPAPGY
jgi:uncharacterized glyoxalase superfamily protein PhnB